MWSGQLGGGLRLNWRFHIADPDGMSRLAFAGVFAAVLVVTAPALAAEPPVGNPTGTSPVPAEARVDETSSPDVVIGNGTAQSCTSAAVVAAVAQDPASRVASATRNRADPVAQPR